ncbi:MAG: tyrosine-type recombinase/integrase [Solibacillus sp.]
MSIVFEVKESIRAIDKIGQSKRDAKEKGTSGIHSKKQKVNTMSDCQNFVKWARAEHGVKSLAAVTEQHYQAYIDHLREKGVTTGHMQNVETSLRLLEKGFKQVVEKEQGPTSRFEGFCPSKRLVAQQRGENIRNRSYDANEVQQIRANCSPEVQKAVDLMRGLGLRVKESVNVRREHFKPAGDGWKLQIEKGGGITKGGRFRDVPVPAEFVGRLKQLMQDKEPQERLVQVTVETVRDGVKEGCKKAQIKQDGRGTHGFRHAYARERFNEMATPENKQMMTRILDNRALGRKADYGIHDQQLYKETKAVMDKVHEELGHGESRWALAMRYLRD